MIAAATAVLLVAAEAAQKPASPAVETTGRHGWRAVPWGAGDEVVRRVFGHPLGPLEAGKDGDAPYFRMVGIYSAPARRYTIRFIFDSDRRLRGVNLTPIPEGLHCAAIRDELADLYGRPTRERSEAAIAFDTMEWDEPDRGTRIELSYDHLDAADEFCLIRYRPIPSRTSTGL